MKMLYLVPKDRIRPEEALNHPFFAQRVDKLQQIMEED
jgi:hypothetical protein